MPLDSHFQLQDREIFMSFGLINDLTRVVNPDNMADINIDSDFRHSFLALLLAERSKGGKVLNQVDPYDVEMTPDEAASLIAWAQDHILDFFLRSFKNLKSTAEKHQETLTDLASFLTGSQVSVLRTPSAG